MFDGIAEDGGVVKNELPMAICFTKRIFFFYCFFLIYFYLTI